jgi:hypothetical protein
MAPLGSYHEVMEQRGENAHNTGNTVYIRVTHPKVPLLFLSPKEELVWSEKYWVRIIPYWG